MWHLWMKSTGAMSGMMSSTRRSVGSHMLTLTAGFSKYISKSRTKRLPLTTKRAGKGFYKGNGARKEGVITSKGRFLRDKDMCTELVVPDLIDCKLKPYIASGAKRNVRELNVVDIQQVA